MKKNSNLKKRILASIVRTIIAIIIIVAGLMLGKNALHWRYWLSENNLGICILLVMYVETIFIVSFGVYLISPIYIEKAINKSAERFCRKTNVLDEEEYGSEENIEESDIEECDYEEDDQYDKLFEEKIIKLKSKYLW